MSRNSTTAHDFVVLHLSMSLLVSPLMLRVTFNCHLRVEKLGAFFEVSFEMLRWVCLLVCCVVAVHLAAAVGEVTCDTLKSGAPVAIPSHNGSLTPTTVLLENCRWARCCNVQLLADGPFVVVLRDVQLIGGSLTVVVSGGMDEALVGSTLILQSSNAHQLLQMLVCQQCLCTTLACRPCCCPLHHTSN